MLGYDLLHCGYQRTALERQNSNNRRYHTRSDTVEYNAFSNAAAKHHAHTLKQLQRSQQFPQSSQSINRRKHIHKAQVNQKQKTFATERMPNNTWYKISVYISGQKIKDRSLTENNYNEHFTASWECSLRSSGMYCANPSIWFVRGIMETCTTHIAFITIGCITITVLSTRWCLRSVSFLKISYNEPWLSELLEVRLVQKSAFHNWWITLELCSLHFSKFLLFRLLQTDSYFYPMHLNSLLL